MEETAIVILNWNTSKETIGCLNSLKQQTYQNYKIYLVDNASKKEELDLLVKYLNKGRSSQKIMLIKNNSNLGFSGGNNSALKKAVKHKYVFLLNNDTTLDKKCIEELIKPLKYTTSIGAVNPKIYYYDDKKIIWAAGANYNEIIGKASLRGIHQKDNGQFNKEETLTQLVGAAVLVKSSALKRTGFFDEDYFCYYEETDLFHRMKKNGFILYYAPKAVVYHKVAMSSGGKENPNTVYYLVRNRKKFINKNLTGLNKITALGSVLLESITRAVIYLSKSENEKAKASIWGLLE